MLRACSNGSWAAAGFAAFTVALAVGCGGEADERPGASPSSSAASTGSTGVGSGGVGASSTSGEGGIAGSGGGGRGGTGGGGGGGAGGTAGAAGAGGAEPARIRIVGANTTSGNQQSYDPGEGTRIFQGLHPDIALIQEFRYGDDSDMALLDFVDNAFGPAFVFYRESTLGVAGAIPNGVISRFPIVSAGSWDDPVIDNRSFVWAQIDVPGPADLWAISLHLSTGSSSERNQEAASLVASAMQLVPSGDLLVVGGDLNTDVRTEACVTTLAQLVQTAGPYPADQLANDKTSSNRTKPYDWVLADVDLEAFAVPVVIGQSTYPQGLVFDSRVYDPLAEVAPVLFGDSAAPNMQHMAVVRDFVLPP